MRDDRSETTRQTIKGVLIKSFDGKRITELCEYLDVTEDIEIYPAEVLDHLEHLRHTQSNEDWQLYIIPPECYECQFDGFDELLNIPSRCPECRCERIVEPRVTIRVDG